MHAHVFGLANESRAKEKEERERATDLLWRYLTARTGTQLSNNTKGCRLYWSTSDAKPSRAVQCRPCIIIIIDPGEEVTVVVV